MMTKKLDFLLEALSTVQVDDMNRLDWSENYEEMYCLLDSSVHFLPPLL
jgi:hypothetical protein